MSSGISNKARKTFTNSLMGTTDAMGIQTTMDVVTHIGAVFESGEDTSTRLEISTIIIFNAGQVDRLTTLLLVVWVTKEIGSTLAESVVSVSTANRIDATLEIFADTFTISISLRMQNTDFVLFTVTVFKTQRSVTSLLEVVSISFKIFLADTFWSTIFW